MLSQAKDIGGHVSSQKLHLASIAFADNGTPQNGSSIDAQPDIATTGRYQALRSALFVVEVDATLAGSQTLDLTVNLQHAPDDGTGSPGAFVDVPAGTLLGTEHGGPGDISALALTQIVDTDPTLQVATLDVELARLERHVRLQVTPTFTGAGDSALISVYGVLGGPAIKPPDATVL